MQIAQRVLAEVWIHGQTQVLAARAGLLVESQIDLLAVGVSFGAGQHHRVPYINRQTVSSHLSF